MRAPLLRRLSLLVTFLLVTFSWLFRGFSVALICLEKQCLGVFHGFFVAFRNSEQLPCRSAEVKNFSVFLCQRRREIWREILVKFSVLRFPGFGCATENFTKISHQKRCEKKNRKFHENFTLPGSSLDGGNSALVIGF